MERGASAPLGLHGIYEMYLRNGRHEFVAAPYADFSLNPIFIFLLFRELFGFLTSLLFLRPLSSYFFLEFSHETP